MCLEATAWIVTGGRGIEIPDGVSASVTFEGGRMAGSTGCNHFSASYRLHGESLSLGPTATTRMACPPPLDALEHAYLDALGRVARWRVEDGRLSLMDADGDEVLAYVSSDGPG